MSYSFAAILLLTLLASTTAWKSVMNARRSISSSLFVASDPSRSEETTGFKALIDNILSALPQVLDPSGWNSEMKHSHLVSNPKKFTRASTLSGYKRSRDRSRRGYDSMQISRDFAEKYGISDTSDTAEGAEGAEGVDPASNTANNANTANAEVQKKKLQGLLAELDELELLDELDDLVESEAKNFVIDALAQSLSPMAEIDLKKTVKEPKRLFHGVKLSKINQVLKRDPSYFDH